MANKIPLGCTCHYERIDGEWYVVWGRDFQQDEPGKMLVDEHEATYLEIGYQIAKSEER